MIDWIGIFAQSGLDRWYTMSFNMVQSKEHLADSLYPRAKEEGLIDPHRTLLAFATDQKLLPSQATVLLSAFALGLRTPSPLPCFVSLHAS